MKKFHLITRAVITQGDCVLLARQKGMNNTFLPGDHIEIGESATTALQREIFEELKKNINIQEYLGAVEADWEEGEVVHYEINHIFKVNIDNLNFHTPIKSYEDHLEFFWSKIHDLEINNLLPSPLIMLITKYYEGDKSIWWASTLL